MNEFRIEYEICDKVGTDYNGRSEYHISMDKLSAPTLLELYELMALVEIDATRYSDRELTFCDEILEVNIISTQLFDNTMLLQTNSYHEHNEKIQQSKQREEERKQVEQDQLIKQKELNDKILYEQLKKKFDPNS